MKLKTLSWLGTASVYIVLVMGALVTNTGSGQGCGPHWPLCQGRWYPLLRTDMMIEWNHRLITLIATLLILWLAWRVFFRDPVTSSHKWLMGASLFFFFLEGGLGAATVLWPEPSEILALHFGVSLLAYSFVFLLAVALSAEEKTAPGQGAQVWHRLTFWLLLLTFATIYTGAYVHHTGSFCHGWPVCSGVGLFSWPGYLLPQLVHRLMALALFLVTLYWWKKGSSLTQASLRQASQWGLLFMILQVVFGAFIAWQGATLLWTMLHAASVPLFFSAQLYGYYLTLPQRSQLRKAV
ncbi:MAG: COX15/CtaA family protein [Bacillota bacterium]|nr:COX15/CtaA family protein [Bacillota bacterium]